MLGGDSTHPSRAVELTTNRIHSTTLAEKPQSNGRLSSTVATVGCAVPRIDSTLECRKSL
jgi:hypothetical protein